MSKISGPLLGRIDIRIEITPVPFEKLADERKAESSVEKVSANLSSKWRLF